MNTPKHPANFDPFCTVGHFRNAPLPNYSFRRYFFHDFLHPNPLNASPFSPLSLLLRLAPSPSLNLSAVDLHFLAILLPNTS